MIKLATLQRQPGHVSDNEQAESSAGASETGRSRRSPYLWKYTRLGELFGADVRSLAVFRMAMALLVLMDLGGRALNLRAHYSDSGVLPRDTVMSTLNQWRWSLLLANGTTTYLALMFAVAAIAAIAMFLGYHTRIASIIVWIMVVSIQVRNPLVLSGADTLLRMMLFWAMLLPLGRCWSLDSRFRKTPDRTDSRTVLSMATFGVFMQICFMYWFTAALKSSPEWLSDGTALSYATGAGQITRPLGEYIHQFPLLLRVLTHASLVLEIAAPILLFSPFRTGPVRTAAIASIMIFHVGIYMTMDVGIFPFTSALCMTCFLPAWFWDSGLPRAWASITGRLPLLEKMRVDLTQRGRSVLDRLGPQPVSGVPLSGSAHTGLRDGRPSLRSFSISYLGNIFAAFCLVFIFAWNMTSVTDFQMPKESRPVAYGLALYQKWNMFAPRPPAATRWYVVRGELKNGQEVDLLTPIVYGDLDRVPELSWDQPDNIVGDYYRDKYWRKYFEAIGGSDKKDERLEFAGYTCRTWNAHYGGDVTLVRVEIYRMSAATTLDGSTPAVRQSVVGEFTCN